MIEQYVPVWLVAILALAASVSLWLVKPMPRLVRISIITPLVYIGLLHLLFSIIPPDEKIKALLIRVGLIFLFIPIIANSIAVRLQWRKGKLYERN